MGRVVPSQVVRIIDQMFPFAATQVEGGYREVLNRQNAVQLAALVELVEHIPEDLLVLNDRYYLELVTSIAAIKVMLRMFEMRDMGLDKVSGVSDLNPVTLIRRSVSLCPDEAPARGTTTLDFISDLHLREILARDISAATIALSNGEWKATTVLSGSVVEALLLWALEQRDPAEVSAAAEAALGSGIALRLSKDLGEWNLHALIEVAAKLGIISTDTATQARLAKDFRNLIHPGRERARIKCDRATAYSAMAALEHVARELTPA